MCGWFVTCLTRVPSNCFDFLAEEEEEEGEEGERKLTHTHKTSTKRAHGLKDK